MFSCVIIVDLVAVTLVNMSSEACTILPTYTEKPKERPRQPEQWTRNAMKAKRAKGESYTRADGTVVAARKAGSPCSCKLQCFAKFTAEETSCLLESFNDLGTKNLQDAYLHGLISPKRVQRHRPRQGSRAARRLSYSYKVVILINLHPFDVYSYY